MFSQFLFFLILCAISVRTRVGDTLETKLDIHVYARLAGYVIAALYVFFNLRLPFVIRLTPMRVTTFLLALTFFLAAPLGPEQLYSTVNATLFAVFVVYAVVLVDNGIDWTMPALCFLVANMVAGLGAYALQLPFAMTVTYPDGAFPVLRLAGVNGHTFPFSVLASLSIVLAVAMRYRRKISLVTTLGTIAVWLVAMYLAKTRSVAVFAFSVICMILAGRFRILVVLALVAVCVSLPMLLSYVELFHSGLLARFSRSGDLNEIFSMTGRSEIWKGAIELIKNSPFIGYGYSASKSLLPDYVTVGRGKFEAATAHNVFIQAFLNGGIVAFFLVLMMAWLTFRSVFRIKSTESWAICLYLFCVGMTGPGFLTVVPDGICLLFLVAAASLDGPVQPLAVG